ncbi:MULTISPECIES: response regulator [unclassified Butyrivibrio]|uniref:response regulator n=1 Tax=unclassified Butyrivibrio TaxID=2639466 RepID=UPI0003B2E6A4|nr:MULTISPECIES: response regulator [unclassified Butyrivibrio]
MSRILLIDDDEDMLAMTGRWLEKGGYEVMKAASGKEALSMMASDKPDLVLLDYAMPEMDGPAVLAAIRSNPDIKDIPVVYRTGMDDSDCEGSGDVKPDGIVSKSEGRPSLMKAVEAILG